jgi:hypothetical protein
MGLGHAADWWVFNSGGESEFVTAYSVEFSKAISSLLNPKNDVMDVTLAVDATAAIATLAPAVANLTKTNLEASSKLDSNLWQNNANALTVLPALYRVVVPKLVNGRADVQIA